MPYSGTLSAFTAIRLMSLTLRHQIDPTLPSDHEALGLRIGADMGRNRPGDAAGGNKLANANFGPRRIIRDHREVARPALDQSIDSVMRRADPMKPPIVTVAPSGTSAAAASGLLLSGPRAASEPATAPAQVAQRSRCCPHRLRLSQAVLADFNPRRSSTRWRMMNFCTFPVAVIGNSSTNST